MDDQEALQQILNLASRTLQILESQIAGYGSLQVPAHLQIELEEKRKEVASLKERLSQLQEKRPKNIPDNLADNANKTSTEVVGISRNKVQSSKSKASPDRRKILKWMGLGSVGLIIPVVGQLICNSDKYTRLSKSLEAKNWEEADTETNMLMKEARKDKTLSKFPSKDLREINQLWVDASIIHYGKEGKFGFSVQKEIYKKFQADGRYNFQAWNKFCAEVGWRNGKLWIFSEDFENPYSPNFVRGHFPTYIGKIGCNNWEVRSFPGAGKEGGYDRCEGVDIFSRILD